MLKCRAFVIWCFLFLFSVAVRSETLADCEQTNKLITFHSVWDLSGRSTSAKIPRLALDPTNSTSGPTVLELTVGSTGRTIAVRTLSGTPTAEVNAVIAAMANWTFEPVSYEGRPICMRARVLVYVKNREGAPELIISGFTDKDRPPRGKR
jgi:hypothetical protein